MVLPSHTESENHLASRMSRRSRLIDAAVENQWLGARPLEARSQGGASGPTVQLAARRRAVSHQVGRDGRRVAAPSHAGLAAFEPEDRAAEARAGLGEGLGHRPGHEQAGGGQGPAEVPVGLLGGPGAVPAEAVAVDQPAVAAGLEVLDDPLELEPLRELAAVVAAGQPDVAPDQPGARRQLDPAALVVAAAPERDRRAGQDDQAGVVLDLDGPLLGGVARPGPDGSAWPTGRSRRPCVPCPRRDLDQVAVAVHQAGGEVDQVEQRRRLGVERERGHQPDGDLLVAGPQAGLAAGPDQLDPGAADPRRPGPGSASQSRNSGGVRNSSRVMRTARAPT